MKSGGGPRAKIFTNLQASLTPFFLFKSGGIKGTSSSSNRQELALGVVSFKGPPVVGGETKQKERRKI